MVELGGVASELISSATVTDLEGCQQMPAMLCLDAARMKKDTGGFLIRHSSSRPSKDLAVGSRCSKGLEGTKGSTMRSKWTVQFLEQRRTVARGNDQLWNSGSFSGVCIVD